MAAAKRPSATRHWDIEHRPVLVPTRHHRYLTHQVLASSFTAAQCRELIGLGTDAGALDATVQDGEDEAAEPALRQARVAWLGPDDCPEWVFDRLVVAAERANETYRFDLTGFTEDFQFTTYDQPGSFYTWHQDGLDGAVAGRKLSLVVQLSDPTSYEGSDLELLEVAEDYDETDGATWRAGVRRRGTVIAFPAFEYHRVTPLIAGIRHSLVCWVGGPPFR